MKLDNVGSRAIFLVTAMLGTGFEPALAGTNQWTPLGPYGGAIKTLVIDPRNTSTMYAGTWTGVFKTIDGAASWIPAGAGLPIWPVSELAIDPRDTSTLYAWAVGSGLFKSTDGAASWNAVALPGFFAVFAVAIAPGGVIYAGGTVSSAVYFNGSPPYPYGAVLKSLDGGTTWSTQRLPGHFVARTLAIDPQSPDTVYVSADADCWAGDTCDPADMHPALIKTTDGGASWSEGTSMAPAILVLDPGTPNSLYSGTAGGGIFKSTDGGANWNAANSGIPDGFRNTLALAIDPASPGTLYTVIGSVAAGSIFKSTDAGASWREVNSGVEQQQPGRRRRADRQGIDPFSFDTMIEGDYGPLGVGLVVDPASPGTVYVGTNGDGVFKSTDGGTNWRAANPGLSAMPVSKVAVDQQHPGTVYTAGWSRFFKTADGGLTWRGGNWGAPALFTTTFAIDPQTPNTIYAGQGSIDFLAYSGGSFKSTDGGMNWSSMRVQGLHAGVRCDVVDLVFDPHNSNTLYAGSYSCGLGKTTDQGETWNVTGILPCWSANPIAVDPLNSNTIYASGCVTDYNGPSQVYKSLDGGMNWSPANSGLSDPVFVLLIDPKTPATLYAGVSSSRSGYETYKSTDGAASWKQLGPGSPVAIDPQNPRILYAAMAGGLARSGDGGVSWTDVSAGLPSTPGQLAFDPLNSNTVYAPTNGGVFAITFAP